MLPWLNLVILSGCLDLFHLLGFIDFDVVHIDKFSLVVLNKLLHGSASVASALGIWVSCDSHDSGT